MDTALAKGIVVVYTEVLPVISARVPAFPTLIRGHVRVKFARCTRAVRQSTPMSLAARPLAV